MGRNDPQFNLRMSGDLKEKVKQRARLNGRSLNSELVHIIEEAIAKPSAVSGYRDKAERNAAELTHEVSDFLFDKLSTLLRNSGGEK